MKKIFNDEIKNFDDFKNDIYFKDMDFKGIEEQTINIKFFPNEMDNINNFYTNNENDEEENIEDKINLFNYEEEL